MKGFIEITTKHGKQLLNVKNILRIHAYESGSVDIITKELIHESQNAYFTPKESYGDVKELIRNSQ